MHCSTSLTQLPLLPRLPRGLVSILILSLLLHTLPLLTFQPVGILPSFTITTGRWQPLCSRAHGRRYTLHFPSAWRLMGRMLPRLIVRLTLLTILLHASGWAAASALTWSVLIIPVVQTLLTMEVLKHPTSAHLQGFHPWRSRLQRVYQSLLVLLVLSAVLQGLNHLHATPGGLLSLVGLSVSARSPDDAAEIRIERDAALGYCITLRGTFQLLWEPRDRFEKWMLLLFLRRLTRVGETRPFLRLQPLADAFEVAAPNIHYWIREVET